MGLTPHRSQPLPPGRNEAAAEQSMLVVLDMKRAELTVSAAQIAASSCAAFCSRSRMPPGRAPRV
jgi:hypothetical protein